MTRPSRNTDHRLIEAAQRLIPRVGFRGLTVREIAKEAGVNPGMFIYYFKNKEKFLDCVMRKAYDEFFAAFSIEVNKHHSCIDQLRHVLLYIGMFIRDNRALLYPFIQEIILGNEQIITFAKNNMTRHIAVVAEIIDRCRREGHIVDMPLPLVIMTLITNIAMPNFMGEIAKRHAGVITGVLKKNVPLLSRALSAGVGATVDRYIMTDEAVRVRVDMALSLVIKHPGAEEYI